MLAGPYIMQGRNQPGFGVSLDPRQGRRFCAGHNKGMGFILSSRTGLKIALVRGKQDGKAGWKARTGQNALQA